MPRPEDWMLGNVDPLGSAYDSLKAKTAMARQAVGPVARVMVQGVKRPIGKAARSTAHAVSTFGTFADNLVILGARAKKQQEQLKLYSTMKAPGVVARQLVGKRE